MINEEFLSKARGKLKGKVFLTDCFISKCECGKKVQQKMWKSKDEECILGDCDCGNIFISQRPQKIKL